MLFFEEIESMDYLITSLLHCENVLVMDLFTSLLEICIELLQKTEFLFDNEQTKYFLQNQHDQIWNEILTILHEKETLEAIEDVLAAVDDDDSGNSTENEEL